MVTGSRHFRPSQQDPQKLEDILKEHGVKLLFHGDCEGFDLWAAEFARSVGVTCVAVPADWKRWGRAAGPIRNRKMVQLVKAYGGGICIAWPGGRGTANAVAEARRAGLMVVSPEEA